MRVVTCASLPNGRTGGPHRWTAATAATRSVEIVRGNGVRALAFAVLGEIGYRRLVLSARSMEKHIPSPATRLKLEPALLTPSQAEEYAAFRPETDPREVHRRLESGHLCIVGRTPGHGIVTASWVGTGSCSVPYLGAVLELDHDEAYSYEWSTEPAFRGMGAARARLAWELRLMQARGVSRALTAIFPECPSAFSVAHAAGFEREGVLRSGWLRGRRRSWLAAGAGDRAPREGGALHPREDSHNQEDSALVRRGEWRAATPLEEFLPRGPLRALVLHPTAIAEPRLTAGGRESEAAYMRRIEQLHLSRGWAAIGYHFVIMPSGRVYEGRPADVLGAHVFGHNRGTIGVAVAGDFDREQPTAPALAAIDRVRSEIVSAASGVPVVGHRDLAADSSCPGELLYRALARVLSPKGEIGSAFTNPGTHTRSRGPSPATW